MASTDPGLYFYAGLLWLAFFGMVAFDARSPITRNSKILGALTFVLLVVDASLLSRVEV